MRGRRPTDERGTFVTRSYLQRVLGGAGAVLLATAAVACGSGSNGGSGAKVAFLMPDTGSTRYELHDRPGFENKLKELCPDCVPLYNNADTDASKQQQQFN